MVRIARIKELLLSEFRISVWRTLAASRRGRIILVGRRFRVIGGAKISTVNGRLELGLMYRGFAFCGMLGQIRIRGRLDCRGIVRIGHGARLDVGPNGILDIGGDTYFSPSVLVVAMNNVSIGSGCAIGWDTQIVDDNFHSIIVGGEVANRTAPVKIGNHVWIGSRVTVLPGAEIADGCVVASNSTVLRGIYPAASLLAGSPAKCVRSDVQWE